MLTTLNTIPGHVRVRTLASRIGGEDGGKAALDALFGPIDRSLPDAFGEEVYVPQLRESIEGECRL